jgi:hypothetical protein
MQTDARSVHTAERAAGGKELNRLMVPLEEDMAAI